MTEEEFKQELLKINIIPTKEQLNLLDKYYHILIEWNNMMNLTAITEKKQVYLKHFYDSLTITKVINLNSHKKLLDFGTGAGFPGVVNNSYRCFGKKSKIFKSCYRRIKSKKNYCHS